jgi:hypothetical protein
MKTLLLALAAAALTAGSAAAQRPIVPGEVTRGSLSNSDPRAQNDSYYDEWAFEGRRGETVIVTMESGAFDTYLYLGMQRRGNFQEIARDDDGGNGTNSRLSVRLPEDGVYVIRASSLHERTGQYTLTLNGGRATPGGAWDDRDDVDPVYGDPGTAYDSRGGPIAAGDRVRGRLSNSDPKLDNGAPFHLYTYQARRGERLTITLRSEDFDAYLVIGTRGGRHGIGSVAARDDDGAGGHDARLDVTLPTAGEYVIRVNSLLPENGAYQLEVESSLGGGGYDTPRPRPGDYEDDDDDGEVDRRLVGRWGLTLPGSRVQGDDWSSVNANASMGILTIDEDGAYTWRKNGRTLRGQLVPYTPRRGAEAGTRYFTINDGRDEFYVSVTRAQGRRYMQVNARRTGEVVAHGYREGGSY